MRRPVAVVREAPTHAGRENLCARGSDSGATVAERLADLRVGVDLVVLAQDRNHVGDLLERLARRVVQRRGLLAQDQNEELVEISRVRSILGSSRIAMDESGDYLAEPPRWLIIERSET